MNYCNIRILHLFGIVFLVVLTSDAMFHNTSTNSNSVKSRYAWKCISGNCMKTKSADPDSVEFAECKLTCLQHAGLWPKPTVDSDINRTLTVLYSTYLHIDKFRNTTIKSLIDGATKRFFKYFQKMKKKRSPDKVGNILNVSFEIGDLHTTRLSLETHEGYLLNITTSGKKVHATITSRTFFGARHGLETLSQLIIHSNNVIKIVSNAIIKDCPIYPYRGLMLDTARHYISISSIKRTIEGMAMSKLNTFHWHITDSQSFPYVSKSCPGLSKIGAYSPEKIYTSENISDLIKYALIRGVRIIPEFDAPAHVGEGWQYSGVIINCNDFRAGICSQPPCAQLNPILNKTYDLLENLYRDMIRDFNPEFFHMGGDEVSFFCWSLDESINEWMINKSWPSTEEYSIKLWDYFQRNALKRYQKYQKFDTPIILWNGILTQVEYIHYLTQDRYIIQVWNPQSGYEKELIERGYRIILSSVNALYLDCGFDYYCKDYKTWDHIYDFRVSTVIGSETSRYVLGAEVTTWTEKIDESYLDSRIWPRASAMAEVFWSEPDQMSSEVKQRFLYHRERLVQAGLNAEAIETEWCVQNDGVCVDNPRKSRASPYYYYDL